MDDRYDPSHPRHHELMLPCCASGSHKEMMMSKRTYGHIDDIPEGPTFPIKPDTYTDRLARSESSNDRAAAEEQRAEAKRKRMVVIVAFCNSHEARRSSRFNIADDRLSRAASAVKRISDDHMEGVRWDAGFDAGEFSTPAHAAMEERETKEALAALGFTVDTYNAALRRRCGERFTHFSGLLA